MWIVLSEEHTDLPAMWAYHGLKARGLDPLELISPQLLLASPRWEHRLGLDGVHIAIDLPTGKTLDGKSIRGVLNRIAYLPPALFQQAISEDRMYAMQEMTALFMSWLTAVPAPVLNRPVSQGLCGAWRHPSEWAVLASRAGLPTFPFRQSAQLDVPVGRRLSPLDSSVRAAFVVAGRFVGPSVPPEIADASVALAKLARVDLLGLEFAASSASPWTFASASPQPDLRLGGQVLLDALAQAMGGDLG
jgi:hypothetical protein